MVYLVGYWKIVIKGKLKRIGLPDSFVQHGSRAEILKSIGLDNDSPFQ